MPDFEGSPIPVASTSVNSSASTAIGLKFKESAQMVAGLRAQKSSHPKIQSYCPHAAFAAGPHGEQLAKQLNQILPQLKDSVLTRSQHIDESIRQVPHLKQVVLAGAGLDMRSIRHAADLPEVTFFEVDLPEMIAERERVTKMLPQDFSDRRVLLNADFNVDDLDQVIGKHPRFDRTLPTIVIFEGCSMYFLEAHNQRIFRSLLKLIQNPLSCVWADFVSNAIVTGQANHQQVTKFLEGMKSLGETFIFGIDEPANWLGALGYRSVETISAGEYLNSSDAVLNAYLFSVAKR